MLLPLGLVTTLVIGSPPGRRLRVAVWALLLLAPTGFWAGWHLWTSGATIREDEARAT